MGEHAAVFSRPALVAAVDVRLRVRIEEGAVDGVEIDLPDIEHREILSWSSILDYTGEVKERWRQFAEAPTESGFDSVVGDDPAHVVKLALGEAQTAIGGREPASVRLIMDSDVPVGAGFGSSAAAAVAVIAAYLGHRGEHLDLEKIDRSALEVERRQHGLPSGIDSATVIRGGLLWVSSARGSLSLETVDDPRELLARLRVHHSGPPHEATGKVVAAVRARAESDPRSFGVLLDRMEECTLRFRDLLREGAEPASVVEPVRRFQSCLEELGVVPNAVRELIRRVEAEGGAAKISGAGALSGAGAGSLLVYHPEPERIATWEFLENYREVPVRLGAAGVREEVRG